MRLVSAEMTEAWKSPDKTGDKRPTVRATIQRVVLQRYDYDTATAPGGEPQPERHRRGTFTSILFGNSSANVELRNIQSCQWSRSLDQDVATCTIELLNSELSPIGSTDPMDVSPTGEFDLPGMFTYNRGSTTVSANRWGYDDDTGWRELIAPDRLIRTYEGYGSDETVPPALDENLVQTGAWLIDRVTYTDTGSIEIECRDVGRLLLDQIVFPPNIPYAEYPLTWEKMRSINVPGRDSTGGSWDYPRGTATSSNNKYIGEGLTDPPYGPYVGPYGGVNGHTAAHALKKDDTDPAKGDLDRYWWSTGQTTAHSKVWWQVDLNKPTSLAAVRLALKRGPYAVFISVKTGKGWVGRKKIPYDVTTGGVDVDANIRFVKMVQGDAALPFDVTLPRKYKDVRAVRITFTRLLNTQVGNYPFRAGLKWMQLYTGQFAELGFHRGQVLKVVGNYRDYTDIVKWVCAWGGFYWPEHSTGRDFMQMSYDNDPRPDGGRRTLSYAARDVRLPKGRAWGDFEQSGTAGEAKLTIDLFDKKPLMDIINYVRDVLGFNFFVDETGGVVWRMPNLWKLGNYVSPTDLEGRNTRKRTSQIVTIDEEETLLAYSTTLDSQDLRERIFVANNTGKTGIVIKGFTPYNTGLRRIAGWTDQHFENRQEVRIMADMLAARQMFSFRRSKITIPGYPALQIDDQCRVFERVTNETYYHYILGISSNLDMRAGTWTYDMDTHWLGERPSDAWVVRVDELDAVTQNYLNLVGVGNT